MKIKDCISMVEDGGYLVVFDYSNGEFYMMNGIYKELLTVVNNKAQNEFKGHFTKAEIDSAYQELIDLNILE